VPSVKIDRQKVVGGNTGGLQTGYQDPLLEDSALILSATASIRTLAKFTPCVFSISGISKIFKNSNIDKQE
jgi:hypothetical protein